MDTGPYAAGGVRAFRHRPKPQIAIKSRHHEYAATVTAANGEHLEGDAAMPLSIRVRSDTMDAIPAPVPAGYQSVIKNVTLQNVTNLFGDQKSHVVPDAGGWRIDRQNPMTYGSNAQIQRNGVKGKSTIGCVVLPDRYNTGMPPDHSGDKGQGGSRTQGQAVGVGQDRSTCVDPERGQLPSRRPR